MPYVIADLHLDHASIIDYCDRPFDTVQEMNDILVTNWNTVIDPDDPVIFLGDLTVKSDTETVYTWVEQLHGDWVFVTGNHDTVAPPNIPEPDICDHYQFTYRGIPFFCVHDPADAPWKFRGWVLHGHHHNNHVGDFPFVNPDDRRVNVSVELLRYSPLHLDEVISYLQRMDRLAVRPDPQPVQTERGSVHDDG